MEILGIGASELIFILLIAIIVLGPKDMQKAGRTIGRWLNHLVRSDGWKVFQKTSTELRNLPRNLMREANMELQDIDKEIRGSIDPRQPAAATRGNPAVKPKADLPLSNPTENSLPSESKTAKPTETDSDEND
ncbi:MAG: twin-arginine translocase TatA/TatE family subunit [Anaerolineales bacterium]